VIYAACVVGCRSWMVSWPGWQTARVLRRFFAMGRPGRLGRSRWAELGEVADLVHLHRAGLLTQLAPASAEPGGQLLDGGRSPVWGRGR
jgi:hypothetical protein